VSDYIKRLEEAVARNDALNYDAAIVVVQDLRSLLSDAERMRGALEEIVDRPGCGMDWERGVGEWPIDEAANMARIARKALSEGTASVAESVTEGDMAAFVASDRACYEYPEEDQAALRAAFVAGATWIATDGSVHQGEPDRV